MRLFRFATAALLAALPTLAFAWTPDGPAVGGGPGYVVPFGQPPAGYPFYPGPLGSTGPQGPLWSMPPMGYDPAPGTFPGGPPWTGGAPDRDRGAPAALVPAPGRLEITPKVTDEGYLLDIALGQISPDQVEIRPAGRGLVIIQRTEIQTDRQDSFDNGQGYQRRYSFARSIQNRRLPLPPDADVTGLSREVSDGHLLIRIPRRTWDDRPERR